jgi:uncharacterized circularly permuted ATP-grasp superfamily protein/uncharacterized alpha-E superfamily protein
MAKGDSPATPKPLLPGLDQSGSETCAADGGLEPHYRRCLEAFSGMSPRELARRQGFVDRATEDLGLHVDRLRSSRESMGAFRMDLFPRILRPEEWQQVAAGVLQRVEAFGAYIRDIYNGREILRAGVLSPELVFEDPAFHPELHNIPLPETCPITIGAVDLIRTGDGTWMVLENRLSTPTGLSYVIQIRRILAQALPELFASLPVFPVASFATRLSEALSACANPAAHGRPLIVLLSEGESGRHFFEESFLARHMGIPLTRPEDMIVREGRVFLKTIEGLLPIDVIYRRLEPANLDPVAFANVNETGIPGLIQCLRRGTVKVANAMGCAVADNRALLRHADAIIRFYSGRRALLPTVPTYHGYDLDQADWMRDNLDSLTLKTVCHPETLKRSHPQASRFFEEGNLATLMETDPRLVVGQQIPGSSRLPVIGRQATASKGLVMRVFCIMGQRPMVLPGGLTRLERTGDEALGSGKHFHALKDTWALEQKQPRGSRSGRLEPRISINEIPLPSRAAEAAYWMGRYLERGLSTARMLNTLEELRWGELSPGERELYAPLWLAMIKATGGKKSRFTKSSSSPAELTRELLLDESDPASVKACFNSIRFNAQSIRSFITPELWRSTLQGADLFPSSPRSLKGTLLRDFIESVVRSGDSIYGVAHRTLLHDAGWHFLNTGMHLERGLNHVVILAEVMPHIAKRQLQHLRDDSDLTALLRLLGALDAYHRNYRSRAYLDRVAELLWKTPACTSSIVYAARSIESALASIGQVSKTDITNRRLFKETGDFIRWIQGLPLERIFPARAVELDKGLTRTNLTASETIREAEACLGRMQAYFESTHDRLENRFFSHIPDKGAGPA